MSVVGGHLPVPLQVLWGQAVELQELVETLMRGSAVMSGTEVPVSWLGGCHIIRVEGVITASGSPMGRVQATTRIRLRRQGLAESQQGSKEHLRAWKMAINADVVGHEEVVAKLVDACGRMLTVPSAPPPAFLLTGCSGVGKTAYETYNALCFNSGR